MPTAAHQAAPPKNTRENDIDAAPPPQQAAISRHAIMNNAHAPARRHMPHHVGPGPGFYEDDADDE